MRRVEPTPPRPGLKHGRHATWALALVVGLGAPARSQEPPLEGLDRYVREAMQDWEVPGLALAVIKDDSMVYARGYGTRTVGHDQPVDPHTIFAIGSATKAFTTSALGALVDDGRLNWDAPVIAYLPTFQLYDPWITRAITPRDLVTHRSGLAGGASNFLWYGSLYDRDEILRRARFIEPAAGFRTRHVYQNIMFLVAGQIVAAVEGETWDAVVRRRFLDPLGMVSSTTSIRPLPDDDNVATPHAMLDGEVQPVRWRLVDNIGPAGSINSNVVDMARWVRLHLNEGAFEGRRILREETVDELRRAQNVVQPERAGSMNVLNQAQAGIHFFAYGLGWYLFDYRGRKVVWHGGNIDGMSAVVAMIPQEELGMVALTNMNSTVIREAVMLRVFDAFLGAPPRDWSTDILRITQAQAREAAARRSRRVAARVSGTQPSHAFSAYAARYTQLLLGEARVDYRGGQLVLEVRPGLAGPLEHWHYDTFRVDWNDRGVKATFSSLADALVTFETDETGVVAAMTIEGIGRFQRATEDGM